MATVPSSSVPHSYISRLAAVQPAVPSTTVALLNPNAADCTVYIWGGTTTVVNLNGTQVGTGAGSYWVGAGDSISITYSGAPSWSWWYTQNTV